MTLYATGSTHAGKSRSGSSVIVRTLREHAVQLALESMRRSLEDYNHTVEVDSYLGANTG